MPRSQTLRGGAPPEKLGRALRAGAEEAATVAVTA